MRRNRAVSSLLIDDTPLQVLPRLARAIGLDGAVVLQQVHYWIRKFEETEKTDHFHEGQYWVYNSIPQWHEQFDFWSERTVKRILAELSSPFEPSGEDRRAARGPLLLRGNFHKNPFNKTTWYAIDYAEVARISDQEPRAKRPIDGARLEPSTWCQIGTIGEASLAPSLQETTVQETSDRRGGAPAVAAARKGSSGSQQASEQPKKKEPETTGDGLDLLRPFNFLYGRPPRPAEAKAVREHVDAWKRLGHYSVTQADLNAAAVGARLWWQTEAAEKEKSPPRGGNVYLIELLKVVAPRLQEVTRARETGEAPNFNRPYREDGRPVLDYLAPLATFTGHEPQPGDVWQCFNVLANWQQQNKAIVNPCVLETALDRANRGTPRTVLGYCKLLQAYLGTLKAGTP